MTRSLWWVPVLAFSLATLGCGDDDTVAGPSTTEGRPSPSHDAGPDGHVDASVARCDVSAVDYATFVAPLMESACLGCHSAALEGAARGGAPVGLDFDTAADVTAHAADIRARAIVEGSMPPGTPLDTCDAAALGVYLDGLGATSSCTPNCAGRACGDDGCGGDCGTCAGSERCDWVAGTCALPCSADCTGIACGDDGCGGSCGTCADGEACGSAGQCECLPDCSGRQCGDDGCGGSCGVCRGALTCNTRQGSCVANCVADCTGLACGDDGCGGSCGGCGADEACAQGSCETVCVPSCSAGVCGDDGCGGSCGGCAPGQTCDAGSCAYADASFGSDVWPLLVDYGCGSARCHGGAAPKSGLDLSSEATAYAGLVEKPSSQCGATDLVAPGAPAQSYLVNKLSGVGLCFGSPMPKAGGLMKSSELDLVRAWIGSGAAR